MKLSECWKAVEEVAARNGARTGAASPDQAHGNLFRDWISSGHHAGMRYLEKNSPIRMDPMERFPWLRSVVVIAVPYESERPSADAGSVATAIARYALGDDYHLTLDRILSEIEARLHDLAPETRTRRYVDTGPLSDRTFGAAAGLGWIGKNSMLIDPEHGSWFFIGTLLTSLENDLPSEEITDRCGHCTRCIEACPTSAILPDRTIDSEACISYATIEHRGPMNAHVARLLHGNAFGCDICQEVCPWNAEPSPSHPDFEPRPIYSQTLLRQLIEQTPSEFSTMFRRSAVKRARRTGMIRNALLVTGEVSNATAEKLRREGDEGIDAAVAASRLELTENSGIPRKAESE